MLTIALALSAALAGELTPEDLGAGTLRDGVDLSEALADGPQAIIHGEPAAIDDYPMTGGLLVEGTAFGFTERLLMCSSTLIAPDVVLAAAHCVDIESMAEEYGVTLEDVGYTFSRQTDLSEHVLDLQLTEWPEDAVHAWDWVTHPDWDMNALQTGLAENYDISLIFLEEPILDVPHAYVILPEEVDQLQEGTEVAVVGWGQQTADAETSPVGEKTMGMSYISELAAPEFQVGLVETDTRKCHGDSGGPSFMWVETEALDDMRIVGVTSHAYDESDCAEKGGVDTRVDHYLEWIDAEMRARCDSGERAWCDEPGLVSPPMPEAEDTGDTGDTGPGEEEPGGCGCATGTVWGWAWLLVLLPAMADRRR